MSNLRKHVFNLLARQEAGRRSLVEAQEQPGSATIKECFDLSEDSVSSTLSPKLEPSPTVRS